MGLVKFSPFRLFKRLAKENSPGAQPAEPTRDQVDLCLAGLKIQLSRTIPLDVPHEVTVVVPRAEIRKKCLREGCPQGAQCPGWELEVILSSITIVHAPRHPLAAPQPPPVIPPGQETHPPAPLMHIKKVQGKD